MKKERRFLLFQKYNKLKKNQELKIKLIIISSLSLILLIFGLFFVESLIGPKWILDSAINSSLPGVGSNSAPSVFYKDSSWYLISGTGNGEFYGFSWNGTGWLPNSTINASLPIIGGMLTTPTIFYKDLTWYMITGVSTYMVDIANFYGFSWNGTGWLPNSTINASLPEDIGGYITPSVFYKDSTWYLLTGEWAGNFYGYFWNGTDWSLNSTIALGLPDIGSFPTPFVFYKDSNWYIISGEVYGVFYGFNWTTLPIYDTNTMGVNNTLAGENTKFYIYINTQKIGLSGFYLATNSTGIWQNETFVLLANETNHTYYLRNTTTNHGQPSGSDIGVLLNTPSTENETVGCGQWIQYWFDEEDDLTNWHINKIYFHIYYNDSGTSKIGYQLNGERSHWLSLYNSESVPTVSEYGLYESTWNVDILPNDITNKSFFTIKLSGYDPQIISGPGMQSYIIITGGIPTTWANYTLPLNSTIGTSVGYRWYFNDSSNNWNSTNIGFLITSEAIPPVVTIISPTATTYTSSSISFELRTNENSTCNYSIDSGVTNYSMTANSIGTGFTASVTLSNGEYVANYYCSDLFGNLNNTKSISFSVSVSSSTSSGSGILKPTSKQIQEGYEKILNEERLIQINLSNGEQYIAEIKEVNKTLGKVLVNINGTDYLIAENSSKKIDLNADGYYDLEISVIQIYETSYAKIEFKEIHEGTSQENKESVTGSIVDNNGDLVNNKYKIIYYILGFVVLVLIVSVIFRKVKRKK